MESHAFPFPYVPLFYLSARLYLSITNRRGTVFLSFSHSFSFFSIIGPGLTYKELTGAKLQKMILKALQLLFSHLPSNIVGSFHPCICLFICFLSFPLLRLVPPFSVSLYNKTLSTFPSLALHILYHLSIDYLLYPSSIYLV